ncbi:MAG: hypothetical protein E3J23_08450 [Candidatus Stahlbacteria bacterium]|nr:MAG: hypothetical protein E3J23_08450 [Candidatus Stahlbacteria bacterium]
MVELTKTKAKEITLEVWRYLRDNPAVGDKENLPERIYNKIEDFSGGCALCEIDGAENCSFCPLRDLSGGNDNCSDYWSWTSANTKEKRSEAAGRIIKLVENWEPED